MSALLSRLCYDVDNNHGPEKRVKALSAQKEAQK